MCLTIDISWGFIISPMRLQIPVLGADAGSEDSLLANQVHCRPAQGLWIQAALSQRLWGKRLHQALRAHLQPRAITPTSQDH